MRCTSSTDSSNGLPRRNDIRKILVIGSGPIVIGQAAEFDYSGAQACKVLLEEGYEVVLVNSNPATIMTDPEFATATYIEPLLPASVAKVIEREKPDAMLPTLGGGTALDLARQLSEDGTLAKHRVELIGADYDAIRRAEDRDLFRATVERAGLRVPRSKAVKSMREADRALAQRPVEQPLELLRRVRGAAAVAPEREGRAEDDREAERAGKLGGRGDDRRLRHPQARQANRLAEALAVLGAADDVDRGPDQLDAEVGQGA